MRISEDGYRSYVGDRPGKSWLVWLFTGIFAATHVLALRIGLQNWERIRTHSMLPFSLAVGSLPLIWLWILRERAQLRHLAGRLESVGALTGEDKQALSKAAAAAIFGGALAFLVISSLLGTISQLP